MVVAALSFLARADVVLVLLAVHFCLQTFQRFVSIFTSGVAAFAVTAMSGFGIRGGASP